MSPISVITFNTRLLSACGKVEYLHQILEANHWPDIVLLQETNVTELEVTGYQTHLGSLRLFQDSESTCTAVLVKRNSFEGSVKMELMQLATDDLYDATIILVRRPRSKELLVVGSIYVRNTSGTSLTPLNYCKDLFEGLNAHMLNKAEGYIFGGDFNMEFTNFLESPERNLAEGARLLKPSEATQFMGNTLDYFIVKGMGEKLPPESLIRVVPSFGDHSGVCLTLFRTEFPINDTDHKRLMFLIEKKQDVSVFTSKLAELKAAGTMSLKFLMTNDVILEYNWTGRCNKMKAEDSDLFSIIQGKFMPACDSFDENNKNAFLFQIIGSATARTAKLGSRNFSMRSTNGRRIGSKIKRDLNVNHSYDCRRCWRW